MKVTNPIIFTESYLTQIFLNLVWQYLRQFGLFDRVLYRFNSDKVSGGGKWLSIHDQWQIKLVSYEFLINKLLSFHPSLLVWLVGVLFGARFFTLPFDMEKGTLSNGWQGEILRGSCFQLFEVFVGENKGGWSGFNLLLFISEVGSCWV